MVVVMMMMMTTWRGTFTRSLQLHVCWPGFNYQSGGVTGAVLRWGRGELSPKPEPCPTNLWLQQQYAVVKPANSYTGGGVFFLEGWSS